ncbi:hypothetical protein BV210_17830 (plasmid) [Halorientalis sp. IM1011]|nr:hypothetical protein BV210_17830 [Halorientalis sp. IM1011]
MIGIVLFVGGVAVVAGVGPLGSMVSVPDSEAPTPAPPGERTDAATPAADENDDTATTREPIAAVTDTPETQPIPQPPTTEQNTSRRTTQSGTTAGTPVQNQTRTARQTRTPIQTDTPRETQTTTRTDTRTRTPINGTENGTTDTSTEETYDNPFGF